MSFLSRSTALSLLSIAIAGVAYSAPANDSRALPTEIVSAPLPQALAEFAGQTGLQLVYESEVAEGRSSHAVPAGLSPSAALEQLLLGTGLDFVFLNSQTVKIFKATERTAPTPNVSAERKVLVSPDLEEIVVSATKRDEPLGVVPISVSVLSAMDMQQAGVKDFSDIAALTPGVEYDFSTQWGPGLLTNLAIRGINSSVGAATTGVYIDDAPIQTRNEYSFGNPYPFTFDLARVEILRGPQGTLFGGGAEGGAVRFVTIEPSTTSTSGTLRAEVSATENGGLSSEFGAAVGLPIVDGQLGARVSAWYREDGGYIDRVDPFSGAVVDPNANRSTSRALRIALAFQPTDSLHITPSFAYQSLAMHDTQSFYTYLSNPAAGSLENGKLLRQPAEDHFLHAVLKLEEHFGAADLTAITSYFDRVAEVTVDTTNIAGALYLGGFGNPLGEAYPTSYSDAAPTLLNFQQIVLSQELRLTSAASDSPLSWVGGLFYSRARQDVGQYSFQITAPQTPGILSNDYGVDTDVSAFGQGTLAASAHWSVTAGLRVSRITTDLVENESGLLTSDIPPFTQASRNETAVTPRVELAYKANDRSLVYAAAAKGFRPGGITIGRRSDCGETPSYASDSDWNYELGIKESLFDRRLELAASAFLIKWNDIQEDLIDTCGFGYTGNAGSATSRGFDLSAAWVPNERAKVRVALGLVDVRYDRTVLNASGEVVVGEGTAVGGLPAVPSPWNLAMSAEYHWPLNRGGATYVRLEDIAHSRNPGPFTEADPRASSYDPAARPDSATNLLNLQLGFGTSHLDIRLFINNVLNTQPSLQRSSDVPGSSLIYAYTFRPRTVGITSNWTL